MKKKFVFPAVCAAVVLGFAALNLHIAHLTPAQAWKKLTGYIFTSPCESAYGGSEAEGKQPAYLLACQAEAGDDEAEQLSYIGYIKFREGERAQADAYFMQAAKILERRAYGGDALAQYRLGVVYAIALQKNGAAAGKWLCMAAENGVTAAADTYKFLKSGALYRPLYTGDDAFVREDAPDCKPSAFTSEKPGLTPGIAYRVCATGEGAEGCFW
jgi:hypothetical protein